MTVMGAQKKMLEAEGGGGENLRAMTSIPYLSTCLSPDYAVWDPAFSNASGKAAVEGLGFQALATCVGKAVTGSDGVWF